MRRREPAAGVSLIAEQGIAAVALAAVQQNQTAVALIELGEHSSSAHGMPSGLKIACNRKTPEVPGVWAAPVVVGHVGTLGAGSP